MKFLNIQKDENPELKPFFGKKFFGSKEIVQIFAAR